MNKINIRDLDQEVKAAHEELVRINNQYNELLTNIFVEQNNKEQNLPNEDDIYIKKKKNKINLIYWVLLLGIFICRGFGLLSIPVYTILFISNLVLNIILLYKLDKKKDILKANKYGDKQSINKDELYEALCKAREKYHTLRKKREEVEGLEELVIDKEEVEAVITDTDVKQLSLEK